MWAGRPLPCTGATLGDMTLPLTAGAVIAQLSPFALVPFVLVGTAVHMLVGFLLQLVTYLERRRRRRRSSVGVAYSVLKDGDSELGMVDSVNSVPSPWLEVASRLTDSDASHRADSHTLNPFPYWHTFSPEESKLWKMWGIARRRLPRPVA